jgi:Heterokaryon incompatibility protein (HET)
VWGDTNTDDADFPYSTVLAFSDLPRLIQDAIKAVKNLRAAGQRYLWVDKYCIDQKNLTDKHRQIKNMDSVYERALATIVALLESEPSPGFLALVRPLGCLSRLPLSTEKGLFPLCLMFPLH